MPNLQAQITSRTVFIDTLTNSDKKINIIFLQNTGRSTNIAFRPNNLTLAEAMEFISNIDFNGVHKGDNFAVALDPTRICLINAIFKTVRSLHLSNLYCFPLPLLSTHSNGHKGTDAQKIATIFLEKPEIFFRMSEQDCMTYALASLLMNEKIYSSLLSEKEIKKEVKKISVYQNILESAGCPPVLSARLISLILDIRLFPKISDFHGFCGVSTDFFLAPRVTDSKIKILFRDLFDYFLNTDTGFWHQEIKKLKLESEHSLFIFSRFDLFLYYFTTWLWTKWTEMVRNT